MKKLFILSVIASLNVFSSVSNVEMIEAAKNRLRNIHSKIKLIHGDLAHEYEEQLMSSMYLPSDAKVLELGGNVGRNSCVIGSILQDSRNLVVLEPSKIWAHQIEENRDLNRLHFHVDPSAISKVPLVQMGWVTYQSEVDLPDHTRVDITSFNELESKYGISFDTLVADCEGALYYILKDSPEMLQNIKLVLVENDYPNSEQQKFVEDLYVKNGLKLVYSSAYYERLTFYQVWKK